MLKKQVTKKYELAATYGASAVDVIEEAIGASHEEDVVLDVANTYLEIGDPIFEALQSFSDLNRHNQDGRGKRVLRFLHMSPYAFITLSKHIVLMSHFERAQLDEPAMNEAFYRIDSEGPFFGPANLENRKEYFVNRFAASLRSLWDLEKMARLSGIRTEFAFGESRQPFVYLEGRYGVAGVYSRKESSELGNAYMMCDSIGIYHDLIDEFRDTLAIGMQLGGIHKIAPTWEAMARKKINMLIQPADQYLDIGPVPDRKPNLYPSGYTNH